jgi:glycosyltransferase involved in cell wall biosynthesis
MILNTPKISVCIVTYRRDSDLMNSLAHLEKSTFQAFEILIVDNGGSQELEGMLELAGIARPVRLIQAPENRGCANLNLLFPLARGEVIACFDDDSFPAPDCLQKAWELFQSRPQLGMIGFKMHEPQTGEPWHDPWWNPNRTEPCPTVLCPGCGLAFRNDPRLPSELCIPDIVSQAHELSMAAEIARLEYEIEFRPECVAFHPDTTVGYTGTKREAGALNQMRFLSCYSDPLTWRLIMGTHWILRIRGLHNHVEFLRDYRASTTHRPLERKLMARFRPLLDWHIHPWLRKLIPS